MVSLLVDWVNKELNLDLTESSLETELSSGFLLGALLHRHNQLPRHDKLRRRSTPDAKIQNFCLLEPELNRLGVKFDSKIAKGIMDKHHGIAAMVLYQMKIALDKLAEQQQRPTVGKKDGTSLPLLPAQRGSKPMYDATRSRLFEDAIRVAAENPNNVMIRRKLKRFDDHGKRLEEKVAEDRKKDKDLAQSRLDATRIQRLYEKQRETAFQASWDQVRGKDQWQAAHEKMKDDQRKKRDALRSQQQKQKQKLASQLQDATRTFQRDTDLFEQKLPHFFEPHPPPAREPYISEDEEEEEAPAPPVVEQVEAVEPISAPATEAIPPPPKEVDTWAMHENFYDDEDDDSSESSIDRDDPFFDESRMPPPPVIEVPSGDGTTRILDQEKLEKEFKAQTESRKQRKAEEAKDLLRRQQRVREFIAKRDKEHRDKCKKMDEDWMIKALTRKCKAEIEMEKRIATIWKFKDCMVANRQFREEQYKLRSDADLEDLQDVEAFQKSELQDQFHRDVNAQVDMYQRAKTARSTAKAQATTEFCAGILNAVLEVTFEAVTRRSQDRCDDLDLVVCDKLHVDVDISEPLRDAIRLLFSTSSTTRVLDLSLASEKRDVATAWEEPTSLAMANAVPVVPPSVPPGWTTVPDHEEEKDDDDQGEMATTLLEDLDVREYLANDATWASEKLAGIIADASDEQRYALGEAVIDVGSKAAVFSKKKSLVPVPRLPPRCSLQVCLVGRAFAGRLELAEKLASSYGLEVLSTSALLEDALREAEAVALGKKTKKKKKKELAVLGTAAKKLLDRGATVTDDIYAALVAYGARGVKETKGWILADFPETAAQMASLEFALVGYDASAHVPSKWDLASPLAEARPEEHEPVLIPGSSAFDVVFLVNVSVEKAAERALAMRCPETPGAPLDMSEFDAGETELRAFLKRFGTLRDVENSSEMSAVIDGVLNDQKEQEQQKRDRRALREKEYHEKLTELQNQADATSAPAAAARAFFDVLTSHAEDEPHPQIDEATRAATVAASDTASALSDAALSEAGKWEEYGVDGYIASLAAVVEKQKQSQEEQRDKAFPPELGFVLLEKWRCFETSFLRSAKAVFRVLRDHRLAESVDLRQLRFDLSSFLARPDSRPQTLLANFVADLNFVAREMRYEDETKAELHLRLEEARAALWTIVEERRDEAKDVLEKLRNDKSLERSTLTVARAYGALVQLEVDRTHASIALLSDYNDILKEGPVLTRCTMAPEEGTGKKKKVPTEDAPLVAVNAPDGREPTPPEVLEHQEVSDDAPTEKKDPKKAPLKRRTSGTEEAAATNPLAKAVDLATAFAAKADGEDPVLAHQATLLQARVDRLNVRGHAVMALITDRRTAILGDMASWIDARIHAEFAVVEDIVRRTQNAIENDLPIDEAWTIDQAGILLRVDPSRRH